MQSPFCAGEDNCGVIIGAAGAKEEACKTELVDAKDELSQWLGVYCPHYQRFFCTGETDGCKTGCCATPDDYHRSLVETMERLK
ncbi:MAG: hypothetical protein AYK23_03765 [Candidatus Proteinoplasmatales archaeon SG8-5]|nr:MAG: hypothetical protein AYK23_03765 [Candidatus Proteinoplasmatales archaeon SG8-5]